MTRPDHVLTLLCLCLALALPGRATASEVPYGDQGLAIGGVSVQITGLCLAAAGILSTGWHGTGINLPFQFSTIQFAPLTVRGIRDRIASRNNFSLPVRGLAA